MVCHHRVNNIKISFKIQNSPEFFLRSFARSSSSVSKVDGNFFVLRDKYVYVIFFSGHVNCTKLRTLSEIDEARAVLDGHLLGAFDFSPPEVDNISASGVAGIGSLNLRKFAGFLRDEKLPFRFNPERFPGLNFRLNDVTFVLFSSGKFLAVGSKSLATLSILVGLFSKYLEKFSKIEKCHQTATATAVATCRETSTTAKAPWSAPSAD